MIGAIAGDIIGSVYERDNTHDPNFQPLFHFNSRFTDDTVCTIAIADALMNGLDVAATLREYYKRYPLAGYGPGYARWAAHPELGPYYSSGSGAAMRISPVGWIADSLDSCLSLAQQVTEITHNHPEGIRGAQVVAGCIFHARQGKPRDYIAAYYRSFGYPPAVGRSRSCSCQVVVPVAVESFLESFSWESAVRIAVSKGGDSDTIASIAGAISEAFYNDIPWDVWQGVRERLTDDLIPVVTDFQKMYLSPKQPCPPQGTVV